jgi:hypothetical protein
MATTVTKTWNLTAPVGTASYSSSVLSDKITELKASGDLVSITTTVVSDTETTLAMVWKDEAARASFQSWMSDSGEAANVSAHNSSNSISQAGV